MGMIRQIICLILPLMLALIHNLYQTIIAWSLNDLQTTSDVGKVAMHYIPDNIYQ